MRVVATDVQRCQRPPSTHQATSCTPPSAASGASAPSGRLQSAEQLPSAVRLVLTIDGKTLTRDITVVPQS